MFFNNYKTSFNRVVLFFFVLICVFFLLCKKQKQFKIKHICKFYVYNLILVSFLFKFIRSTSISQQTYFIPLGNTREVNWLLLQ